MSATVNVGPAAERDLHDDQHADRDPALNVVKSVTSVGPYDTVGDVITYAITVTNTGNVTLTGVTVTDPGAGAVLGTCTPVDPGDARAGRLRRVRCDARRHAGRHRRRHLHEHAIARFRTRRSPTRDAQTVPITQNPALNVLKTVDLGRPVRQVGDVITYSITATNTGNQTLTG